MEIVLRGEKGIRLPRKLLTGVSKKVLQRLGYNNNTELSIFLVSDPTIRKLNKSYRNTACATDVLSFCPSSHFPVLSECQYLGDVVISVDTARRNAKKMNHTFKKELTTLLIHGILHLAGYGHEEMVNLQNILLKEVLA